MLVWVFGGTAVGKKHFIYRSVASDVEFPGYLSAWMDDGDISGECLSRLQNKDEQADFLVRWQWGRERQLASLRESRPDAPQRLILLTVSTDVNHVRATLREGYSPWTKEALTDSARGAAWLAMGVAAYYKLDIETISYE